MLDQEVFNTADYEIRLARNQELMVLVAGEFITEAKALYEDLYMHLVGQDWANFALVAHRLKGASLEVSGYRFCQLITNMETLAKEQNGVGISSLLDSLKKEFDQLVAALEEEVLA